MEGYEVAAAGYLLKPLDETRLNALLERRLIPAAETPSARPRLALKCGGSYRYFVERTVKKEGEMCRV